RYGGIAKHRHTRHFRRDLLEQLQPFDADSKLKRGKSGDIAAGPRQACDKAAADRIDDIHEYDRQITRAIEQRSNGRKAAGKDDVRCEPYQFRGVATNAIGIASRPASVNPKVAANGPSQCLQSLQERSVADRRLRIVRSKRVKEPDTPRPLGLLRARRQRPRGRRAAEKGYERAAVHVWMAPAWQEKMQRAAQKSLAVMCPACSRSPDGLLALMESANRGLITRAGSMSR